MNDHVSFAVEAGELPGDDFGDVGDLSARILQSRSDPL
jgi:hypothetical protein